MFSHMLFRNSLRNIPLVSHRAVFSSTPITLKIPLDIQVTLPSEAATTNTPVVLLLGWLGCQDKNLKKYSKIYEERGLITVRYTAPIWPLIFPSKYGKLSEGVLNALEHHHLQNRPIVVHTFSNGGAFFFRFIIALIEKTKRPISIKGQIFDSGPCSTTKISTLKVFYNVLYEFMGKNNFYSSIVASLGVFAIFNLRLFYVIPVQALTQGLDSKKWIGYDIYRELMSNKLIFPQLFLYSKEDKLMPYKDVEIFAKFRKEQGVPVKSFCFSGSEHVLHYLMYSKEYKEEIYKFLDHCLYEKKK